MQCHVCEETDRTKLRQCADCRSAVYCSIKCQKTDWFAGHSDKCIGFSLRRRSAQRDHIRKVLPEILAAFEQFQMDQKNEAAFRGALASMPVDSSVAAGKVRQELVPWADYFVRNRGAELMPGGPTIPQLPPLVDAWYDDLEWSRVTFSPPASDKARIHNGFVMLFSLMAYMSEAYRRKDAKMKDRLRTLLAAGIRSREEGSFTNVYPLLMGIRWGLLRKKINSGPFAHNDNGYKIIEELPWKLMKLLNLRSPKDVTNTYGSK